MADQFVGKWHLVETENFDEYMKAVGVGFMTRKLGAVIKPLLTISVENGKWHMVSESTFKTVIWDFEMDKQFDETTPDGREMRSTYTMVGDKLVQKQEKIKSDDKDSVITRHVEGNKLFMILEAEGVTCRRVYEKM